MYPADDLAGAEERLRDFLIGRFGGPPRYIQQRGHPRLRMRHMPFSIDMAARNRWVQLMDAALVEAALPAEAVAVLQPFFHHMATFMINTPGREAAGQISRLAQTASVAASREHVQPRAANGRQFP